MATRQDGSNFETLIRFIHESRGMDFRGYKRSSLKRRIDKRMAELQIRGYATYRVFLTRHPHEYDSLINTVLINVTEFFRDAPAWKALRERVIPKLIAQKGQSDTIRVWSAGCSTGEEAYSVAMLFAKALGEERYRRTVKIYATDLDEEALASARKAQYTAAQASQIPPQLREQCFEHRETTYVFRRDLRKAIIFGRHDLQNDAPVSKVDLLICRNVLIYMDKDTQERVLPRLHYALNPRGYLFLGRADTLLSGSKLFHVVDSKNRLFVRMDNGVSAGELRGMLPAPAPDSRALTESSRDLRMLEFLMSSTADCHLLVDEADRLAMANAVARRMFSLAQADIGRPFKDLELSYRPVELRSKLQEARESHRPVRLEGPEWFGAGDERQHLTIEIVPLFDEYERYEGSAIHFYNTTRVHDLAEQLRASQENLETTTEALQSSNEELETTNEELQSTNEELETTNEELQSANEELETINEELQSMNEELQGTNEELRSRTEQLDQYRMYVDTVLGSLETGLIVLDEKLQVNLWNRGSEELWGLRADEVKGRSLYKLDIGLPVRSLRPALAAALLPKARPQHFDVRTVNRRGSPIQCRLTVSPLHARGDGPRGLVLLVIAQKGPRAMRRSTAPGKGPTR